MHFSKGRFHGTRYLGRGKEKNSSTSWCILGDPDLVPRVLSYPPHGASERGRVGENPGNEVAETQGQSVGSGEEAGRKFSLRAKEPLGTDSHRIISKKSSGCRLLIGHKKCFVLLCPIGEHISMSSFRVFVHDGYGLDHGLSSVLLGYAPKKCTQSGNFQFDIKSPSDPTRLLCQMQANSSEPYQSS